jgi:hypothetical protein
MHEKDETCEFLSEYLKERYHSEDLGEDGKMLECILGK